MKGGHLPLMVHLGEGDLDVLVSRWSFPHKSSFVHAWSTALVVCIC